MNYINEQLIGLLNSAPSIPERMSRHSVKNEKASPKKEHHSTEVRRPSQPQGRSIWSPEARNKRFSIQIERFTNVTYEDQTKVCILHAFAKVRSHVTTNDSVL